MHGNPIQVPGAEDGTRLLFCCYPSPITSAEARIAVLYFCSLDFPSTLYSGSNFAQLSTGVVKTS